MEVWRNLIIASFFMSDNNLDKDNIYIIDDSESSYTIPVSLNNQIIKISDSDHDIVLASTVSNVTLYGGAGNDSIELYKNNVNNFIDAGDGNDYIKYFKAQENNNTILGGAGNDTLYVKDVENEAEIYTDNSIEVLYFEYLILKNASIDINENFIKITFVLKLAANNKNKKLTLIFSKDIEIETIFDITFKYKNEINKPIGSFFGNVFEWKNGVYDIYGKEIIPCIYDFVFYSDINDSFIYEGSNGYISLNISLDSNGCVRGVSNSAGSYTISAHTSSLKQDEDYGTNSKHGKIVNRISEKQGTITVTKEMYEDGYSSIFIMDKCKACGGTGKVGFNFCTAGCAMGITTLLTYYDQNGNEVESTGTMANHNNPYSSGGSGGSYSGGSSSGSSSSSSSVYTKCTSCNGTGRCSSCNGRGYKFNSYSGHDDSCPSCRGKGSCPICYGRGKL